MKLRIRGNSLRLRIARSEMARLIEDGRIEETIRFGARDDAKLTYVLARVQSGQDICMEYGQCTVTILISNAAAQRWAQSNEVGIYGDSDAGYGTVALMVEKDFACLDGNDPDDPDAFSNPSVGTIC